MAERHSERARVADDWYIEPSWCVDILLDRIGSVFTAGIHDPCCGLGTIPLAARARGIAATGADLRQRDPEWERRDFLADSRQHPSIVTNPPYAIAVPIISQALEVVAPGGLVCALVQAKFLFSQRRKPLFERPEMERVIILSRRPSMPPGEALAEHGEKIRGGGSIDFCWCVWRVGRQRGPVVMGWAI